MLFLLWMPCTVKKTLQKIVEKGNHYLIKVKGNQPKLKLAIEETVISSDPIAYHREKEISRGRCEIRETYLYAREDNLDKGWESINLIVYLRREFISKNKTAAANLAMFRNFAYNILKEKNKSIKQATEIFANYNVKKLLYILLRT